MFIPPKIWSPSFHSYWAIYINLRLMLVAGKSTLQTYGRRNFEVSLKKREGRGAKLRVVEGSWSVFQWQIMQFGWNPQWKTVDSSCSASRSVPDDSDGRWILLASGLGRWRLRTCLVWVECGCLWFLLRDAVGWKKVPTVAPFYLVCLYGGFHKWGYPQNGLFIRENPSINGW